MAKPVKYYKRKTEFFYSLGKNVPILKDYSHIFERYYYNEIKNSIEYQELNEIYSYIFEYLIKYMDILEQTSIEEIYAYALFLVKLKYLDYKSGLKYYSEPLGINEIPILSPLVFNEHARCRHISSFLTDLYNEKGYPSLIYAGIRQGKKELLAHKRADSKANHSITVVSDSKYSYLLDLAKEEVFTKESDDTLISNKQTFLKKDKSKIISIQEKIYFELPRFKRLKDMRLCCDNIHESIMKLSDNLDIFEELHKEITPALESAENVYQRILKSWIV